MCDGHEDVPPKSPTAESIINQGLQLQSLKPITCLSDGHISHGCPHPMTECGRDTNAGLLLE